ncbi:MAG: glycoside hydrolase family 43 protein [Acidobacteria bacterium]|nr:glycoside hydrolase family 43 protein [Acidobacteriota bacterium]
MSGPLVNPIVRSGADPWVVLWRGEYLYCRVAAGNRVTVSRARRLRDIGVAEPSVVWTPPRDTPYSEHVWAPELHRLGGRWYVYFAADDGSNANHRMYALVGEADDPQGPFAFRGKVADPSDQWAIDGTVLPLDDGSCYFVWSGWEGADNVRQNIYIAPMNDPLKISGARACISTPRHAWERVGTPHVNEGPQVLRRGGRLFIIYSASGSWTDDYCLGQLAYAGGDLCRPESWLKKPVPVFSKTGEVFGPGHACFVRSADGAEDWVVYHAARFSGAGWDRDVRAQRFAWHADGSPDFGRPVPPGVPLRPPSGDP